MRIHEYSGAELEDVAGEVFVPVIARTAPGYRGRMALHELGETLALSRAHWGPMSAIRTARMAARASEDDLMLFCVQTAGECGVHQNDRFVAMTAGTGLLAEACSPSERVSSTETRTLTLRFSRELLPLRAAEITEGCARSMHPAAPAMQVLTSYLSRLFAVADDLTAPQRLDAGQAAIDLLTMVVRDVAPSVPSGNGPGDVLLDMMRMHVRDHLADPNLGVEELARRHHVSVRRAYTLFERIGTTPGAYLREQRLLAAQVMLSDQRYTRLGMSRIAAAVGFRDLRTFERAFLRAYGMTPAGWRREHGRTASAPASVLQEVPPH
ncbi:helix-turn-helix domain-containing protein [Pseudonocardia yunnanensis]|uniref:AraC family transcriptional regulator n=1 Tax=Pseudonocardia yunnanensis TaxID=58107 RepID=A0ABW4EMY2_9PSEU